MGFADDIRTIAKTKEIMDKADKAFAAAEEAKKEAIKIQRIQVGQTGNSNLKDAQVGTNGSGETTTGTGVGGAVVEAPLAPPINPADDNNDTLTNTDAGTGSYNNNGVSHNGGTYNNNLIGGGSQISNSSEAGTGTTRTESKEQADPDNAPLSQHVQDYIAKRDAMIANGATADEIDAMRREHFSLEKGKHEIGDVMEGKAGPKPASGTSSDLSHNETLNSVVGVDPNDPSKTMEIRFDNRSYIPSIEESAAAGQPIWASIDTPPAYPQDPTYRPGYYWTSYEGLGSTYCKTFTEAAALTVAYMAANDPDGEFVGDILGVDYPSGSPTTVSDSSAIPNGSHSFSYVIEDTRGAFPDFFFLAPGGLATCPAPPAANPLIAAVCETGAPPLTYPDSYPTIGHWVASLVAGKFIYSLFDSEVPLQYKSSKSSASIKSAINGHTYTIEPTFDGGMMMYDETAPAWMLVYNADRTLRFPVPIEYYNFYAPRPS